MKFHFSNHCYSRDPKENEVTPPDMLVRDEAYEGIFDTHRYALSHWSWPVMAMQRVSNGQFAISFSTAALCAAPLLPTQHQRCGL
ncbi:MAG: hypothetical protein J7603_11620 [Pseudacidovorax sp.]|nr:hypothetical protein [Pseudacidovorax sp.]